MRNISLVLFTLLPSLALAQGSGAKAPPPPGGGSAAIKPPVPPAKPKAPPETAETVSMFKGNWNFDATLSATGVPGMEKPFKGKMSMTCKAIVGGNAAACDAKMLKTPMGPWEGHFVIAWDPFSKAVHFMAVTNMFEVHDHVCGQWDHGMAGKSGLMCTPLKGGSGPTGDEITEDVMFSFHKDGKELNFTSTSKMKGGATFTFEGAGKK